jgi:hypothetical protein
MFSEEGCNVGLAAAGPGRGMSVVEEALATSRPALAELLRAAEPGCLRAIGTPQFQQNLSSGSTPWPHCVQNI